MTSLLDFLDRHPIATGATGSAVGIGSWLADQLHFFSGIITDLGLIAGGLLSIATACVWFDSRIRAALRARAERRRHFRDAPFEDHLP